MGEYDAPQIHGLGEGYTQVLINGRRVPGSGADRSVLVDRIQIIRSPSADQGSQGVGGTINIILKDSGSLKGGSMRLGMLNADNQKYRRSVGLGYGAQDNNVAWSVSGVFQEPYVPKAKIEEKSDPDGTLNEREFEDDIRDSDDISLGGNVSFALSDQSSLDLNASFVSISCEENQQERVFEDDDAVLVFEEAARDFVDIEEDTFVWDQPTDCTSGLNPRCLKESGRLIARLFFFIRQKIHLDKSGIECEYCISLAIQIFRGIFPMLNNDLSAFRVLVSVVASVLLFSGCAEEVSQSPSAEQVAPAPVADDSLFKLGFIAFGDSGYHSDYLKDSQIEEVLATEEEYINAQRADWLEDKKHPAEFASVPSRYIESQGGYIEASGLYPVAQAMENYCQTADCQFSVMLGDNIYPDGPTLGADGKDDTIRFETLFTDPFGDFGSDNPDYRIYVTLGNHDWNTSREGAMSEVEFMENNLPFYMDGLFYKVKPPAAKGEVEIFVIDTEILLGSTSVYEDALNDDGSELPLTEIDEPEPWTKPQTEAEKNMLQWLDDSMKNSTARWKFVVAHHPIWSTGGSKFTQARALRGLLLPTLCQHADVYFAGHEHALELHEDSCESVGSHKQPVLEIISGAAAKQRGVNALFQAYQEQANPDNNTIWTKGMIWGFSHIELDGDDGRVDMIVTPNSGTAETEVVYSHEFKRRSTRASAE